MSTAHSALPRLVLFLGVSFGLGVLVLAVAQLFSLEMAPGRPGYPQVVIPAVLLYPITLSACWVVEHGWPRLIAALLGLALEVAGLWIGERFPTLGFEAALWPRAEGWATVLLAYAFVALVLSARVRRDAGDRRWLLLPVGLGLVLVGYLWAHSNDAPGLASGIDRCVQGLARPLVDFGVPLERGAATIALVLVAVALTLLHFGTRALRRMIEEAGAALRLRLTNNRFVTSALACAAIAAFSL